MLTPIIRVQTTALDQRLWRIFVNQVAAGPVFDDRNEAELVANWLEQAWTELP